MNRSELNNIMTKYEEKVVEVLSTNYNIIRIESFNNISPEYEGNVLIALSKNYNIKNIIQPAHNSPLIRFIVVTVKKIPWYKKILSIILRRFAQ